MNVALATTLSAAGSLVITTNQNSLGNGNQQPIAAVKINVTSNTGVSAVWAVEQLPSGSTIWQGIGFIDTGALTYNSGGSNFTGADSGNYSFLIPVAAGTDQVRLRLVSISSGSITVSGAALYTSEMPSSLYPVSISVTTTAQTVTSTSATALAVGPNGTTNPTFSVNANTASAATGWTVIGAAVTGGVALKVISSGTNESGTIDAKGTGTLTLNGVGGTGAIQFGGAASGNNATGLKVTPNAASSGLAIAVVSTGTNENLTLDAKGSGTLTLQGTATGNVIVGTGLLTKSATGGIGYGTGAGGAVTQITSRTTGVTLNTPTGAITLVSAAGSATAFTMTVTNSSVAALDTVVVSQKSGTDAYSAVVSAVAAGSFKLTITDLTGTTTEQPVFNFAVVKGVIS